MRIFFSYSSRDYADAAPFVEALRRDNEVFFAPDSIPLGSYWQPVLAEEIARSQAFVLLVAGDAPGPWQLPEYYAASDRKVKDPEYPLVPVVLGGGTTRFPFLSLINWLVVEPPLGEATAARINAALSTGVDSAAAPWRHVNPFRDLEALQEADADLFFGRDALIDAALRRLAEQPRKGLVLVGNSGVGKSSLAQAGIVPRLRSGRPGDGGAWPVPLKESPGWLYLSKKPGEDPVRALAAAFLDEWALDPTDPRDARRRREWAEGLQEGSFSVADLVEASRARWQQLGRGLPAGVFLYLDQGEELYRAKRESARRFSTLIAEALDAGDIRMLMSLRSDHYGFLQGDEALFPHLETLDIPPMNQAQLAGVMRSTAKALGARFAKDDLPERIAAAAADQPGAMPILSVYLTQLWQELQRAGDGVLRLTETGQGIDIAAVLEARADGYFNERPERQATIRRLFVPNLVRVPKAGPALRRRAALDDLDPPLRQVAEDLAGPDYRLLTTAEADGKAVVEVAHESLFSAWTRLKDWIAESREFLEWKEGLEQDRKSHDAAPKGAKGANLLMGSRLAIALERLERDIDLIEEPERRFIRRSIKQERRRAVMLWGGVIGASVVLLVALFILDRQLRASSEALRAAQTNESRFLAAKADQLLENGRATPAVLVALEGLPSGASPSVSVEGWLLSPVAAAFGRKIQDRPLVQEVLNAVSRAYSKAIFPLGAPMRHEDDVRTAVFSPDGLRVVTASDDDTARLWKVRSLGRIS